MECSASYPVAGDSSETPGDIIETLRAHERQHALVVMTDKPTQSQRVIGIFSTSQISKLLGYNATPEVHPANSLAQLVEQIA